MKRFGVFGLGNFGSVVARELINLDCQVIAVDTDKARLQALPKHSHLDMIVANAADRKFLQTIGVTTFDGIIVSTGKDSHASIIIAMILRELGATKIVVKANSDDHAKILRMVGATETVIPEQQMAAKLARSFAQPNLVDFLPLGADVLIAELSPPERFVGKKLQDIRLRSEYNVQVIAIKHTGSDKIDFVPGADYRIEAEDLLLILGAANDINRLRR
jgi:trk system potassium uptake protein TrkA